jgi:excisionase family DNA binding protein
MPTKSKTMPTPTTTWLTVQEAASILSVHPATVRKWAATKELIPRRRRGASMELKGTLLPSGEREVLVSHSLAWRLVTRRSW